MPDIDMEWARFEKEVIDAPSNGNTHTSWWLSRAAMITGIIMSVSLITLASIYLTSTTKEEPVESRPATSPAVEAQQVEVKTDTLVINREVFKFDNIEMQTIAKAIGDFYGKQIVFGNDEARHVRLYIQIEKTKSIEEVVAFMNNFQKVHLEIDGERILIR